jgi:hypothetical protein
MIITSLARRSYPSTKGRKNMIEDIRPLLTDGRERLEALRRSL